MVVETLEGNCERYCNALRLQLNAYKLVLSFAGHGWKESNGDEGQLGV